MRPSNLIQYLRPPKLQPIRSPFTKPTTYRPPTLSSSSNINRKVQKQADFNHLVHHAIPAAAKGTSSRPAPGVRKEFYFVHFDDRIKFWNLTAGDRVIIADCIQKFRGRIGTIYWVDRTSNRLSLIEPEFWKEEKETIHPELPEFIRKVPIEFEYSTVRLMAPGSDEMYYEGLREVQHEAVIIPNGGKRREIHWTRIGTRYSIYKPGKQSEGEEIIPWPVQPTWSINVQDPIKRLELRDGHLRQMQEQWELEKRRRNGETIDINTSPTSHIHSRETRKDLFTSPRDSWANTLDPNEYQDTALWLSTSPLIRSRFPEYFSPMTISKNALPSINDDAVVPELSVPGWELMAGRHTRRFKTLNWETNLSKKINDQIEIESQRLSEHLDLPIEQLKRLMQVAHYRPSMVDHQPNRFKPSARQIKRAKLQLDKYNSLASDRERLATLDLLPALESFNSNHHAPIQTDSKAEAPENLSI